MEQRESSERKSFLIKVILLAILLLLSFLATVLYVFLYPKTTIVLYDNGEAFYEYKIKKYSKLDNVPIPEKPGHTFIYWSYNDYGGEALDPTIEVEDDVVRLYANYEVNSYWIHYYISYLNEETGRYDFYHDVNGCRCREWKYGTPITLPTGMVDGKLIPELGNKPGYHFVGWTTKVIEEDDPEVNKYLKLAGSQFVLDVPAHVSLFAYWEKDSYTVNLHTGIDYVLDNNNKPIKDANGDYVIRNISTTDDPYNEQESVVRDKIKYLSQVTNLTDAYADFKLNEKNGGVANSEYEFKGWYFDPEYKFAVNDYVTTVKIDDAGRPYLSYTNDNLNFGRFESVITGYDAENKPIYEFDLYSKWERKSYTINFASGETTTRGKMEPIQLYRLILDEEGKIAEEYGKYYDDGYYSYEGAMNGGHYSRINFNPTLTENLFVTSTYQNSKSGFRLIQWTDTRYIKDSSAAYAVWTQDPWSEDLGKVQSTGAISYVNSAYVHTVSEEKTFYSQWSQIYSVTLKDNDSGNSTIVSGIKNEWFYLPNMERLKSLTGKDWPIKNFCYFAGWKTGTSTLSTKYLEKLEDGTLNPEFYYTIKSNVTLYVYWMNTPYTLNFYLNDGSSKIHTTMAPVYGGDLGSVYKFPSAPTREGYVFDGWSKKDYADGEYAGKIRAKEVIADDDVIYKPNTNIRVYGDQDYYASWTIDYKIVYDANGGEFTRGADKKEIKYSEWLKKSSASTYDLKMTLKIGENINVKKDNYDFVDWYVGSDDSITLPTRTTFDLYEKKYYSARSGSVTVPEADKTAFPVGADNTIVLKAKWEPIKFTITVWDTRAEQSQAAKRVFDVAYSDDPLDVFTFPTENGLGQKYNEAHVGYKITGFALDRDGLEGFREYNEDNMPTIQCSTLTGPLEYFAIYEEKNINIKYCFKKSTESGDIIVDYTPTNPLVTVGTVKYLSTIVALPKVTGADYGDTKYMFKYWYYEDANGQEVKVYAGDKVKYCDQDDNLIIYAKFEVDEYQIALNVMDPYTNTLIENVKLFSVEVGQEITQDIYDEVIDTVREIIAKSLSQYVLDADKLILKGYSLENLFTQGGYTDIFAVGKLFNSNHFQILAVTTSGMTLQTKWAPSEVKVVYKDSEANNANSVTQGEINYASDIVLKAKEAFTFTDGQFVHNWYIIDPTNSDNATNRTFFDCNTKLVGIGGKFASLHNMLKYIEWDENGVGTLVIYANVKQTCRVNYYKPNVLGGVDLAGFVEFVYGEEIPELMDPSMVVSGDLKFEGWYYLGNKVSAIPVTKDNYVVDIYANLTFDVTYKIIRIANNTMAEEVYSVETVSLLKSYDSTTDTYNYLTFYIINVDKVPQLTASDIPEGYEYYGLKHNTEIYSLEAINNEVAVAATGSNLEFTTYYTKVYTLTYSLLDKNSELFDDGTSANKNYTFKVGFDGVSLDEVRIAHQASKAGYEFSGWQIRKGDGNLDPNIYAFDDVIVLSTLNTTLVPVFNAPDAGDIDVTIKYIHGLNGDKATQAEYLTNGDTFGFKAGSAFGWTNDKYELYAWKDVDGKVYYVNDANYTYTIPLAVTNTTIQFTGLWQPTYSINFEQPANYKDLATYTTKSVKLYQYDRNKMTESNANKFKFVLTEVPTTSITGIEFKYWTYNNNGEIVNIPVGSTIYIGTSTFQKNQLLDGTCEYYLPTPESGTWSRDLVGAWSAIEYNVVLHVTDPTNHSTIKYTILPNNTGKVEFNTTYSTRELLTSEVLEYEASSTYGIIGWSTTPGATDIEEGILQEIRSDLTLYSVWAKKVSVKFASTENIKFLDAGNNPVEEIVINNCIPNDTLDINNVIKSIYQVGYMTVYYENGQAKIISGATNDYYQVVGFTCSWGGELAIGANNTFGTIQIQSSDMTLTPVTERVYQVKFFDNTTSGGGYQVTSLPIKYYRSSATNTVNLDIENYKFVTRAGFTLEGWNTNGTLDTVLTGDYSITDDIEFYAIWSSDRSINFVTQLNNSSMLTYLIEDFKLTKDNTIDVELLKTYLGDPSKSNGLTTLTGDVLSKHPAYTLSKKNLYLDGFIVVDNKGNSTIFDIDDLDTIDFGSANYYSTEDINITLIFKDIFTTVYSNGDKTGITGTMSAPDYFVNLDSFRTGKLLSDGTIGEYVLPTPALTRPNYDLYGWSTVALDGGQFGTRYSFSSIDDLTLTTEELIAIANNLKSLSSQTYNLYSNWEYTYIDIYVYTLAEVIDNPAGEDTTLLDPYAYYSSSTDGSDIPFVNTAKFINVGGYPVYYNNYDFNKAVDTKIAQLQYGKKFTLSTNSLSNIVAGYELLGWSKTLYKLGEIDGNYFAIGDEIQVIDTNITDGEIKLYPVYGYATKDLEVSTSHGAARVEFTTNTAVSGFVTDIDSMSAVTIPSNSATTISVNRVVNITITAIDPENSNYIFDHFVGLGSTDNATPMIRTISGLSYLTTNQLDYVNVVFAPKKVKINISIEYDYDVKDQSRETTQINIAGVNTNDSLFVTNIGVAKQSDSVEMLATGELAYVINNNSGLYEYETFSDADKIAVVGDKICVSSLNISSTPDANGVYSADLTIVASVNTYKVTFYMSKGVFKANTELAATNSIFEGVDSCDIVDNVAEVVLGSVITLPTADDISYTSGGVFLGFYLNGDSNRTHITTHTVNTNVAFIEDYADYSYNIYYKHKNGTKHITGLTHGSSYTIGVSEASVPGYEILYWGDEQGNKLFDDGQTITMTRSYNLFAQYEALPLTIKYVYNGNVTGRIETIKFDEDFVTLSEEDLTDLNITEDQFIAGWKFGEKLLGVGVEINFDELEYSYDANNTELTFEAVYYNRYKYNISYDTSKISNASAFASTELVVQAKDSAGTIDEKTLQFTISDKIPLNTNTDYTFTKYIVKYSVDGGQSYVTLDTGDNAVPGATIALNNPTTTGATLGVAVLVIFEPQFENNVVYADVTYVITNPDTGVSLYEGNYLFDPRYALTNVYLPNITTISTVPNAGNTNEPNNSVDWKIQVFSTEFTTTADTIDFYKYNLVGYLIEFYESGVATGVTQTINFTDSSSAASRKVLGSTEFTIKTIWQSVKVIKYFDADDTEMTDMREYVDNTIYSNITLKSITDVDDSYNMTKDGYTLVGWQTVKADVDSVDDYYQFSSNLAVNDYSFYPAFSKNYSITIETVGVLDEDMSKFVYNTSHGVSPTYVYFGMNSSNSIDLTGYSYNKVYSAYDDIRYAFVGYSETETGDIAENFTFNNANISGNNYIFYAQWSKQSSNVTIKLEAYNYNSSTNIASNYSLAPKSYDNGTVIDLTRTYSQGLYTFADTEITQAVNNFLTAYSYFTIDKIVITGSEQNITSHTVSSDIEITIKFAPIYRIRYILPDGAKIAGFNEYNAYQVTNNTKFTNKYPVGIIEWDGYTITNWAYTSSSDNSTKVAMFDDDVTTIDISQYKLTYQYIIELELLYVTTYTVNLYYFTSPDKINEYNIALAADPNMSIADKQAYYDNSVSISIPRGNVAYTSTGTLFDSALELKGYTSFANLLTSLESSDFTSIGLVTIDNSAEKYSVIKSNTFTEYFAKTYTSGTDSNYLFLEYSPIVYEIKFSTVLVDASGNYNEDLQDINSATASYTYGSTKTFGATPYVEHLTHLQSVSLSADSSAAYEFVGWKVLDGDTLNNIDAGMMSDTILSGFKGDMHFVAVFKEKLVTATATIYSDNSFGHTLSVSITSYIDNGSTIDTITPLSIKSEVADAGQFKNTITFELPLMRYVKFTDSEVNDSFDISTVSCNSVTYSSTKVFDLSNVSVDGKADFTINYSAKSARIYLSTCGPELGDNSSLGNLGNVKYTYNGIDKSITPVSSSATTKIDNKNVSFNYEVPVVNGAVISTGFTSIDIKNYTYEWKYLDGTTLKDLPDTMNIIQDTYIVAVYTPNDVTIEFFADDIRISGIPAMTVPYGSTITLPSAVIEFNDSISVGWLYNSIQYSFGSEITLESNNTLESVIIYARFVDRAYVTYSAGDTGFTLPSAYPASTTDSSIVVAESISVKGDYYYARINQTMSDATSIAVSETNGSLSRSNKLVIPNTEISPLFTNWQSVSNKTYALGATYTYSADDKVSGMITLTAHKSDNVEVRFYITDPDNAATTVLKPTNTDTQYVSLIMDKNDVDNFLFLDSTTTTSATFRDNKNITTYQVSSNKIHSNYKLFGWSTAQKSSYSDISQAVSENTLSILNSSYANMTKSEIISAFVEFLGKEDVANLIEDNNGVLSLYTIWETKFEITYEVESILNDDIVTNGLFAKGDVITIPTSSDVTVDIPDSKQWIGWTDGANYYLFEGTIKTFTVPGGKNITFTPYFSDLYTLTFNTNFSSAKAKVAEALDPYATSHSAEEIESAIGNPNYTGSITLDNYQIKNLSPKTQTDLSKITLSDIGIYPTTITLTGATWEDSYFDFLGWATSATATSPNVSNANKYQISKNTTLYAVWQARTFTINMYETYDLANAQGATDNYETVEFGSHFSEPNNPFTKANAKFNRWLPIAPMTDNILNNGAVIVNDLYIYPAYDNVYTVRFQNSQGHDLFTDRAELKVSDGDPINYSDYLPDLDTVTLTKIYYKVVKNSAEGGVSETPIDSTLIFTDPKFSVETEGDFVIDIDGGVEYFTIYVDITYSIALNYPEYPSSANPPVTNDSITSLLLGTPYSASDYTFDPTQYGADVSFGGWYYENNFATIIGDFEVVYVGGEIKFISGAESKPITTLGTIELYAKVLVTVTITLGNDEDESITDYATLEYQKITDTNYITIVDSSLKSVTYTTIYNSTYHPVFAIKLTQGYKLTQDSKTALDVLADFEEKTATDNVWKYSYENITIGSLTAGITKVNLYIETIKITVVYDYAVGDESLRYKTADSEVWQDYATTSSTYELKDGITRHFDDDASETVNGQTIYESDTITLEYTHDITEGTITYTNVPYGATLYVLSVPNPDKFTGNPTWNVGYKNADDEFIEISLPVLNNNYITYKPAITETTYYANTTLTSNVGLNIQLYLDIEKDDAVSVWGNAIDKTFGLTEIRDIDGEVVKYRITFNSYADEDFSSGDSITTVMINDWNGNYHSMYDRIVNESTLGGITINFLLQYFWFDDDKDWKKENGDAVTAGDALTFASQETVNLYHTLDRAVLVNVTHETAHFDNDTIFEDVDRADLLSEYTAPANSVELSQDDDSLIIKVPYGNNLTVAVDPADKVEDNHNAYTVKIWKFADANHDGTGTLSSETSQTIKLDNSFKQDWYVESNEVSFPQVNLVAQVCVESHIAKFIKYLDNSDAEIKIDLGYDLDIEDNLYNQTLASLDAQGLIPHMDQFKYVGDDIYIFLGWMDTSTSEIFPVDEIIREDKTFEPKYINLSDLDEEYKNLFIKLTVSVYGKNDDQIVPRTMTAYLPKGEKFTDAFGNAYNFDITNAIGQYVDNNGNTVNTIVKDFVADVSGYETDAYTFYITAGVEATLANVNIIKDNGQEVTVYPAIPVQLTISYLHDIVVESATTYHTLGGKIELTCDAKGNLVLKNLIVSDTTIKYATAETYTFAYWSADINLYDETTSTEYATNGAALIEVLAWYNPRFKAVTAGFSSNYTSWTDIAGSAPTGMNIAGNYTIEYQSFTFVDGRPQAILLVKDSAEATLHTITYQYNSSSSKGIDITITTPGNSVTLSLGGIYKIYDEDGYINITAKLSGENFETLDLQDFAITNATDNLEAFNGKYTYSGETSANFSTTSTVEIDGLTLKIDGKEITASVTNEYAFLADYLTNIRWQYKVSGTWKDIESEKKLSELSSTIRLAADWITKDVKFARLSSIDTTKLVSTTVDGRDLYAGGLKGGLEYVSYYINGEYSNSITIQLYKGEELEYDSESKMFTIVTSGDFMEDQEIVFSIRDYQTVYIETNNGYIQGWLYDSDNSESRINLEIVDKIFNYEESSIFWAWCEDTIDINIYADTKSYADIVNGYGQVSYMIDDVSSDTDWQTSYCVVNGSYSRTYATITVGVSSKVILNAEEDPDYKHQFVNYKDYSYKIISTSNESSFLPYEIKSTYTFRKDIYVLFNANVEDAISQLTFEHSNGNTSLTVPMYTGGIITYTPYQTDNYWLYVYTPFKISSSYIVIYTEQNISSSRVSSGTSVYPRYGFQIDSVDRIKGDSTITLTVDSMTDISGEILIASDNGITIKLNEILPSILVETKVKYGTSTYTTLSTYVSLDGITASSQAFAVDQDNLNTTLAYSLDDGGIYINISDSLATTIYPQVMYRLVSASFYPTSSTEANTCSYPTNAEINNDPNMDAVGNEQTITLDTYKYTLLITVERKEEIDIAFEFALLESDMATLEVSVSTGANIEFATVEDATITGVNRNIFTVSAPIKWTYSTPTYPYVLTEVSNGTNTVKVYDGNKTLVAEVSYVSHTDYNNVGWYLEQSGSSAGHLALHKVADPYSRIVTREGDGVEATAITSTSTSLQYDCTILLDAERKPLKITIDDNYWLDNYNDAYSVEEYAMSSDPEIAFIKDAINRVSTGTVINTFTGLVTLTFPDNPYADDYDYDYYGSSYYYPNLVSRNINFIKLGDVKIVNIEDNTKTVISPFDTRSDGGKVAHPAFAIMNNSSVAYSSTLTNANEWLLVSVPYGNTATYEVAKDSNNYPICNYRPMSFYSSTNSDATVLTLDMDASQDMTLIRDINGETRVYFWKDKYTRLYTGMYNTEQYMIDYNSNSDRFYNLTEFTFQKSSEWDTYISYYYIEGSVSNNYYFNNSNKISYDLFSTSYPVAYGSSAVKAYYAQEVVYTVTISDSIGSAEYDTYSGYFSGFAGEYRVPAGQSLTLSFDLESILMNTSPSNTDWLYSAKSPKGNYVFLGLISNSISGNYNLLTLDSDSLTQHNYSSNNSGGYSNGGYVYNSSNQSYEWSATAGHTYTISFTPSSDVTLSQMWAEYGRDITYDRMYQNAAKETVHDTVTTHYNTLTYGDTPMVINPYVILPSDCPADYFTIEGYYTYYDTTSGFTGKCDSEMYLYSDTTIYVNIVHDNCALNYGEGETSYEQLAGWMLRGEDFVAGRELESCRSYGVMTVKCPYCNQTSKWIENTGGYSHYDFAPYDKSGDQHLGQYARGYDDTQHWTEGFCVMCMANMNGWYEEHTLGPVQYESNGHYQYCTKNCGYRIKSPHQLLAGSESYEHYCWDNDGGPQCYLMGTCLICDEWYSVKILRDVYDSEYIPCVAGEIVSRHCKYCGKTGTYDKYTPLDHPSANTVTIDATCTTDGGIFRICKNCNECLYHQVLPAGHTGLTIANTKMPTCTENGYNREHCVACGWWAEEAIVIPKWGHSLKFVRNAEIVNNTNDPYFANYCTISYWDYECTTYGCNHTERHLYGEDYHIISSNHLANFYRAFQNLPNGSTTYSSQYNTAIIESTCTYCNKRIGNHEITTLTKNSYTPEKVADDWYESSYYLENLHSHGFSNNHSYSSYVYDEEHCVGYTLTTYLCQGGGCSYKIITNRDHHISSGTLVSTTDKYGKTYTVDEIVDVIDQWCIDNWTYIEANPSITYAQVISKINNEKYYTIDPSLTYYCPYCESYYENNLFMTYDVNNNDDPTLLVYPGEWLPCSNPDMLADHNCSSYETIHKVDTSVLYYYDNYTSQQDNICIYGSYYKACYACAICGKINSNRPYGTKRYEHTPEQYHTVNVILASYSKYVNSYYVELSGNCITCGAVCKSPKLEITLAEYVRHTEINDKVIIHTAEWWINTGSYVDSYHYNCGREWCVNTSGICKASCRRRFN